MRKVTSSHPRECPKKTKVKRVYYKILYQLTQISHTNTNMDMLTLIQPRDKLINAKTFVRYDKH